MPNISNYILTEDNNFHGDTLFSISDDMLLSEIKDLMSTETLEQKVPYKNTSYEFAMIWSCLRSVVEDDSEHLNVWTNFLKYLKHKNIPLTVDYISDFTTKKFRMNAFKSTLKHDLLAVSSVIPKDNKVCIFIENALQDFDVDFQEKLKNKVHGGNSDFESNKNMNEHFNENFLFILNIAKQLYKTFRLPSLKLVNSSQKGVGGFSIDSPANPFPMHKHHVNGSFAGFIDNTGIIGNSTLFSHEENYEVRYQRGDLHHLGDTLGWIVGAMSVKANVILGQSCSNNFFYKISDSFIGEHNFCRTFKNIAGDVLNEDMTYDLPSFMNLDNYIDKDYEQHLDIKISNEKLKNNLEFYYEPSSTMMPKSGLKLLLDKSEDGESIIPFQSNNIFSYKNMIVHNYGGNPVFQKYAHRHIDVLTTDQLKTKLYNRYVGTDTNPFFLKTISGKFVIDVVGKKIEGSTYAVKEGRAGIVDYGSDVDYGSATEDEIKTNMFKNLLEESIYGHFPDTTPYFELMEQNTTPQWIVSEIIDMHDEYRIFIVNHRVIVGSPCHRRSTPLDVYPIGRFHPGLSFSHRSKFIRINQKTRNRVAKYIKFARAFAKEFKVYGNNHKDYDTAIHGNYVLDVAWSNEKNSVVAIEINEGGIENPGNTGMYATNTVKLVCGYLGKKYKTNYSKAFADMLVKYGFKEASLVVGTPLFKYEFLPNKEKYIKTVNLPTILKDKIFTGKRGTKQEYISNNYLNNLEKEDLALLDFNVIVEPVKEVQKDETLSHTPLPLRPRLEKDICNSNYTLDNNSSINNDLSLAYSCLTDILRDLDESLEEQTENMSIFGNVYE